MFFITSEVTAIGSPENFMVDPRRLELRFSECHSDVLPLDDEPACWLLTVNLELLLQPPAFAGYHELRRSRQSPAQFFGAAHG